MQRRDFRITAFILVMVAGIAAWSKLRHTDKAVYDAPGRWAVDQHPAFQRGD